MSGMGSRYAFSLTTFSPSGKLLQIEHALSAVAQGATSIGIKARNGVVIATEKKLPTILIDKDSVEKISVLERATGVVYSGIGPDSKVLVRKGRKSCEAFKLMYQESPPTLHTVRELAAVMQEYTQSGGVRPFGVSLLIAGVDDEGPHLYQVDPSGSYWAWQAASLGRNYLNARTFLEKNYNPDMDLEDAIHVALEALKEGFDGAMDETNIELGIVDESLVFRVLEPAELREYVANL
eukprot:c48142_g1_i1.p2 GENE.c48142_g1_i1~~c48142_g1_i1.p2  ORF type:complete len:252 (+),score=58.22 c48142_g1_i1:48-758(+)